MNKITFDLAFAFWNALANREDSKAGTYKGWHCAHVAVYAKTKREALCRTYPEFCR